MAKAAMFEMTGAALQVSDKSEPPILLPSLDESLFAPIGKLIANWAVMEQQLNILLWALITHNTTNEPGWQKRPFTKRWELLKAEWATLAASSATLGKFIDPAHAAIRKAKVLRHSISHKDMIFGAHETRGQFIRFFNETRTKQKSKPYFVSDFIEASVAAREAAGWLAWPTDPNSAWPLPSRETQILRSLPNTDHLRIPT